MRHIVGTMMDLATLRLEESGQPQRISEVRDMFGAFDLALNGVRTVGRGYEGPESLITEVMTTADFTYALGEFVQRQIIPGYQQKRFEFEPLIKEDRLPNYMVATRYQRRSELDDLEYVGEKGEARPGSVNDATPREYQVYDWQKQFDFDFHALVNDDLGYFQDQGRMMGRSARRTLEKFVSRMYTNATSIARLTGLGALYSQTGRLTSTRISEARMAFAQRTDARGEPIMVSLRYLVHHTGLIDQVRVIRASQLIPELATNAANVISGDFTPIEDPYMAGTAPNLPWYCFSNWQEDNVVPLVLARLQMLPAPQLIRKRSDMETFTSFQAGGSPLSPMLGDFATGNVVVKVWDVWGTYMDTVTEGNLFDFRGAYYSAGTAP